MLSPLFLQESLQLFSTMMETLLAKSLCRHGVISSNQLHSVRQASNQCGRLFSQESMYQLQFFSKDSKQKSQT